MLGPLRYNAGRIREKACRFATGDGSTGAFQLVDRHGQPVTSDIQIASIHQTDWQGRVELSSEARTNYLSDSQFSQSSTSSFGKYAPGNADGLSTAIVDTGVTSAGIPYIDLHVSGTTTAVQYNFLAYGPAITEAGDWIASGWFALIAGAAPASSFYVGCSEGGPSPNWHQTAKNMYLTGDLSYWETPINSTEAIGTRMQWRFGFKSNAGEVIDFTVRIAAPMLVNADTVGAYIPTTTAPVTVTDYTASDTGLITLGQPLADGGTLDWTGTARRAA